MHTNTPNMFQFEVTDGSDQNAGQVFSFWTQSLQFDWNFNQKNRESGYFNEIKKSGHNSVSDNQRPN